MDLALLVADKNMDFTMRGLLKRHQAIGIRKIDFKIDQHMGRDGGVRTTGPDTLSLLRNQFEHAVLMLDWEGSGSDADSPIALEDELNHRLAAGWGLNARAIVIEPELDAWVWGSDNLMGQILGWHDDAAIRAWLAAQGFELLEYGKPARPKEAIEALMRQLKKPRSSSMYESITSRISLQHCRDPAFQRLRETLRSWFPV